MLTHLLNQSLRTGEIPQDWKKAYVIPVYKKGTYVKPHYPISSSSVTRWILSLLSLAGVDTSVYKAHSTRSASVSAAATTG